MLPKNKPVAELQVIQKLIETYKNTLTFVLKDDGYFFMEKVDSEFYFWIRSILPIANQGKELFTINIEQKPNSKNNADKKSITNQIDAKTLENTLMYYFNTWWNIVSEYHKIDFSIFTKQEHTYKWGVDYFLRDSQLKNLTITDFKGISQLFISFSEKITILLGKNASGKTSILQALALALLPDDNADKDREFQEMIKIGKENAILRHNFTVADKQQETLITGNRKRKIQNNYIEVIILGYGTNMFYNKKEKNRYENFVKSMILGDEKHYFTRSLFSNFDDNFVDIIDVLNHLYDEEKKEKEEIIRSNYKEIRTIVALTINNLLPKDLIQIELVEERSYYFVNRAGDNLETDQLSEGYRANVMLLGDMLCRIMAMRGHLQGILQQENPIPIAEVFKEMRGVIIIDEFDRHLHPSWQKVFVDNLLAVLPNMQFVLTTHNPMAILNRKANEVLKLVFNENGQIETQTGHATEDLDVSLVLLEYFEMDSLVSKQLQEKIEKYHKARIEGEKEITEQLKKELDSLLVGVSIHDKAYWEYLKFLQSKGIDLRDVKLGKFDIQKLLIL